MWLSLSVSLGWNVEQRHPRTPSGQSQARALELRSEVLAPGDGISKCSAGTILHNLHMRGDGRAQEDKERPLEGAP